MTMQTITVVLRIDSSYETGIESDEELQTLLNACSLPREIDSIEVTNFEFGDKLSEKPAHFSDRELAERGLPPFAFGIEPSSQQVIRVERGMMGYFPADAYTPVEVDKLNATWKVTTYQAEAMVWGSLFGWHTPGAWPEHQAKLRAKRGAK